MEIKTRHKVNVRSIGYEIDKDSGVIVGLSRVSITPDQRVQGALRGICIPFEVADESILLDSEYAFFYGPENELRYNYHRNIPLDFRKRYAILPKKFGGPENFQIPLGDLKLLDYRAVLAQDLVENPQKFIQDDLSELIEQEISSPRSMGSLFRYFPRELRSAVEARRSYFSGRSLNKIEGESQTYSGHRKVTGKIFRPRGGLGNPWANKPQNEF